MLKYILTGDVEHAKYIIVSCFNHPSNHCDEDRSHTPSLAPSASVTLRYPEAGTSPNSVAKLILKKVCSR